MGIFTPDLKTLRDLYTVQLQKALNMEKQIVDKGLPAMIEKATSPELVNALRTHLEETKEQQSRLERILNENTGEASDASCKAMSALISEGGSDIGDAKDTTVRDVVIIAAGNQVEHHEIAVYGTLVNWANLLGEQEHAAVLEKSLNEEKNADRTLTGLAEQINAEAPAV